MSGHSTRRIAIGYLTRASSITFLANTQNDCSTIYSFFGSLLGPKPSLHYNFSLKLDFENPDLNRFPRFSGIRGMEVALEPGEVLYIPNYWWHYIESEMDR